MNARETTASLGGKWQGRYGMVPCPAHDDRTPSCKVWDHEGEVLVHCFAGCEWLDVKTALRQRGLLPELNGERKATKERPKPDPTKASREAKRIEAALNIWRECRPLAHSPAETYLWERGLQPPFPETLRYHPGLKHGPTRLYLPALVAAVARVPKQKIVAIHRIYLTKEGRKADVDTVKRSLGPIGGGAVRLAKAGNHLAVAEGIETALSVMQATGLPTWSALSAGGIPSLILPSLPLATEVTICADTGLVGLKAARDAADGWTREGRTVRIAVPTEVSDFNDLLMAQPKLKEAVA